MRASLLGALGGGGFDPVAIVYNGQPSQTVPIPTGAVSADVYLVTAGGDASGGDSRSSGNGGNCHCVVGAAIAGATGLLFDFVNAGLYVTPSNVGIRWTLINHGGAGTVGFYIATGGAAATEIANGPNGVVGQFGSSIPGPASITTGSVLAGYVGHGGDANFGSVNGVGWGAGGGIFYDGSAVYYGSHGPPGALILFK